MSFKTLLARIRKFIPCRYDPDDEAIEKGFGEGGLNPPHSPMSDAELSRTIREFMDHSPSRENIEALSKKPGPGSR